MLFRSAGFINNGGGDFLSNQVIGTLDPVQQGNIGIAALDFPTMAGDQFVTVSGAGAPAEPTVDGTPDMAEMANYAFLYAQETFTQFGDNNDPAPGFNGGGSELNKIGRAHV